MSLDVTLHVLATLAAVIALGRCFGSVLKWLGQPAVIGEVLAGIALGPSLLGTFSPEAMHALIPDVESDPHRLVASSLKTVSQLGIVLYMFLVGLELDLSSLGRHLKSAAAISGASLIVPFFGGAALAVWLFPKMAPTGVAWGTFALFMGTAMAITAFPVLARILTDRGLAKTDLGVIALACAAIGDVLAWCLLAVVVGIAQAKVESAAWVTAFSLAFIAGMFLIARPITRRIAAWAERRNNNADIIAGVLAAVLVAALCTEAIGIHAVFGAFLIGVILPHESRLASELERGLSTLTTTLLLPAFFALTGMQTQLQLIHGWEAWLTCLAIVTVATLAKYVGTYAAARGTGLDHPTSHALGALMNTRGLMEIIVLNIGLQLGVIDERLFAMMLIMALATTLMTGPMLGAQPVAARTIACDDARRTLG